MKAFLSHGVHHEAALSEQEPVYRDTEFQVFFHKKQQHTRNPIAVTKKLEYEIYLHY